MIALEIPPHLVDLDGHAAQISDDEFVFRIEMPVERHLVGAGRFSDGLDADAANAVTVKQITRRQQNPLAWPQSVRKGGHLVSSKDRCFENRLLRNRRFAPA